MSEQTGSNSTVSWKDSKSVMVAMSELAHVLDLAMKSGSESVKAFGMLMCTRIALLADGETVPYCDPEGDLDFLVQIGRKINSSTTERNQEIV